MLENINIQEKQSYLDPLQMSPDYQLLLRNHSDAAAQGLLTLLVTINVGAFISVIEGLQEQHWLLGLFTCSTIAALLSRTGIYYIYRTEVTMFEYSKDYDAIIKFERLRNNWWRFTEWTAWISLISFIIGVVLLAGFFIAAND